ncbi:DUF836-domain-containing protein, partial [Dendrothele bispora CBS 962.96]
RLPRFTLYSGPNCSLCDTAKEELAKVRQNRPFHLETVNIQDPGQERWKRKYVYWIPALHLEGREIAKGRWDATVVTEALQKWDQETQTSEAPHLRAGQANGWNPWDPDAQNWGIYGRTTEIVLEPVPIHSHVGSSLSKDKSDTGESLLTSHCFNCGDPDHNVSSCPFRFDRELVSLARDMYNFFKEYQGQDRIGGEFTNRLYAVEEWKNMRLGWLNQFIPGEIRGPDLRDALGMEAQSEWLRNMAVWGYPPGWATHRDDADPKDAVRERILSQFFGEDNVEELLMFGEGGAIEAVPLGNQDVNDEMSETSSLTAGPEKIHRWAFYPATHFSSEMLPVYNGSSLPPIDGSTPENPSKKTWQPSFNEQLWTNIVSNNISNGPPPPLTSPPPPPSEPPPPVPPPPAPKEPPPPLPLPLSLPKEALLQSLRSFPSALVSSSHGPDDLEECDMDMSDDD